MQTPTEHNDWLFKGLDYEQQFDQQRHNVRHPGKVCQHCPRTLQDQIDLSRRTAEWDRRTVIRDRVRVVFALVVILGMLLLAGFVH